MDVPMPCLSRARGPQKNREKTTKQTYFKKTNRDPKKQKCKEKVRYPFRRGDQLKNK